MKLSKKTLLIMLGLLLSVFVAACSSDDAGTGKSNGDSAKSGDGEIEQVINLTASATIPSMDSAKATDRLAAQYLNDTTEGLYRLGENAEYMPGIALDHEISADGLTWTFNLREDAVWANGEPVTAHDFVYGWTRAVDPVTASVTGLYTVSEVLKNGKAVNAGEMPLGELGVKADGDYTFVVTLEKPVPYFESLIVTTAFLPQNQKFVEEHGDKFATSYDTLLSNGPFKMTEWDSTASSWTMEKNEDYWDADVVQIEKMTYNVVKDPQVAVDLYGKGKIDRADISSDLVDEYLSHDDFTAFTENALFYLRLNQTRNEALANQNVRAAIISAFDKQALVDKILNNGSRVSYGAVPDNYSKHPKTGEDFREINGKLAEYDVEAAKASWEKGLKELGTDKVEIELLADDTEMYKIMTEYLANQLETNLEGLSISVRMVPFEQRIELDKNMDYDIEITGAGASYLDPYSWLNHFVTNGGNNMGYSSEKFDELIGLAMNEYALDPVKRFEAFLEAEKVLMGDSALAPMYQRSKAQLISPKLKDVYPMPFAKDYEYKWASVTE
ncbi:peptide ABC transporter substrate-binding protein [Sporosarcina sp. NPDC096371]|uniref:peptide ABC transporter substrate-binding protein n=1 Tax=Sporosarcina sp. NPDC096371 TaxID=3364530 RepID=UPI0038296CB0